jgi:hypothetical protein
MINLRARVERDLSRTLEGEFGMQVTLIDPATGAKQTVRGQVLYFSMETDPATGMQIKVEKPSATVRRSALTIVPAPGERWGVRVPSSPVEGAALETYVTEIGPRDGNSLGMITMYLTKTKQAPPPAVPPVTP